jgi:hypothetical protein
MLYVLAESKLMGETLEASVETFSGVLPRAEFRHALAFAQDNPEIAVVDHNDEVRRSAAGYQSTAACTEAFPAPPAQDPIHN